MKKSDMKQFERDKRYENSMLYVDESKMKQAPKKKAKVIVKKPSTAMSTGYMGNMGQAMMAAPMKGKGLLDL